MANYDSTITDGLGLGSSANNIKKRSDQLGQDEFLKLMVAQLKNQDPFAPMENGDFISQMAQFSSVTGIAELQQSFEQMATSLQSNQALQASSLVGRTVLIPSKEATLVGGESVNGVVELSESSSSVGVTITDSSGQVIRRLELGTQSSGDIYFNWDGTDIDGKAVAEGQYFVNADAKIGDETVALKTLMAASVASVTLGQGGQGLKLNLTDGNAVDFSSVRAIQ